MNYAYEYTPQTPISNGVDSFKFARMRFKQVSEIEGDGDSLDRILRFINKCGAGFTSGVHTHCGDKNPLTRQDLEGLPDDVRENVEGIFYDNFDLGTEAEVEKITNDYDGDAVYKEILYELKYPIILKQFENGEEIEGKRITLIEFKSGTFKQILELRKATTKSGEFRAFLKNYGKIADFDEPLNDVYIDAIDIHDYLVISTLIQKKLLQPSKTWKRL